MNAKNIPPHDNYAAFLARLDAATASLSKRAVSLDKALTAVSLLLGPYQSAVQTWEQRRVHVSDQLARQAGNPQAETAMNELRDMAAKMESVLRARALRLSEKLSAMQRRRDSIDSSLLELEISRAKMNSSRMLSQDRENLNRAFSELSGSAGATATIPDLGLRSDLKEARQAVILAEALMEVKGH